MPFYFFDISFSTSAHVFSCFFRKIDLSCLLCQQLQSDPKTKTPGYELPGQSMLCDIWKDNINPTETYRECPSISYLCQAERADNKDDRSRVYLQGRF